MFIQIHTSCTLSIHLFVFELLLLLVNRMVFVISPASSPFFVLCLSDYSRLFSLKAPLFLCSLFDRLFSFSPFYTLQFDVQFYLLLLIEGDPYLVSLYTLLMTHTVPIRKYCNHSGDYVSFQTGPSPLHHERSFPGSK